MKLTGTLACSLSLLAAALVAAGTAGEAQPVKMSRSDLAGGIFDSESAVSSAADGFVTVDVTSFKSSTGKFASGVYKSTAGRYEFKEPYGVDEFMYFLEGGVRLTSADGTVTTIEAGEAVTIPKEWMGVWETGGYTKIWVIYSEDGSGL